MNKVTEISEFKNAAAAIHNQELSLVEKVVMQGDLSQLNPEQRVLYYRKVCESVGLNPFTRPFDYIMLNGKLTLYAKKDATEQLRKLNGISIEKIEGKVIEDLYVVTATASTKDGRRDESIGAVTIGHLKGDARANAIMKAETKAKRRVTLSISGMGWTDESEIETIPGAKPVSVDLSTGEINQPYKKISHMQVEDLTLALEECEEEYQKYFPKAMKANFGTELIADIPEDKFASIKTAVLKKMHENHEKQRAAAFEEVANNE